MATVPLDDLIAALRKHAEHCKLGWRTCNDCGFLGDLEAQSAATIACTEVRILQPFLRRWPLLCVYCGEDAEHRDHLVPKPWTGPIVRRFVPTVPACGDCNGRIGDAHAFTIAARCEIVAKSLRQKHRKALAIADHDDEWFDEFSPRMASNQRKQQVDRQIIRHRLIVLDAHGAAHVPDEMLMAA